MLEVIQAEVWGIGYLYLWESEAAGWGRGGVVLPEPCPQWRLSQAISTRVLVSQISGHVIWSRSVSCRAE